ncbi:MAG: hypothetical protein K8I30_04105 [Anaerolineae bacterium]|nr:hypothetical protein [Anaerolineae bacterium]
MYNNGIVLFQVLSIVALLLTVVLVIYTLRFLRQQKLPERDLILWDILVIFLPVIGAILTLTVFKTNGRGKP